jgi:endonuclease/exonuclease/phosphatase family metal-dependent hydrolase
MNSKVLFWNIWGHRYADGIHAFLQQHTDADLICLTEVTDTTTAELLKHGHNRVFTGDEAAAQVDGYAQLLRSVAGQYYIHYDTADYHEWKCEQTNIRFKRVGFGSALLVKVGVTVIDHGSTIIDFEEESLRSRVVQWIVYEKGGQRYLVAHLHGVWIRGNTKGDHSARFRQSDIVRDVISTLQTEFSVEKVVLGGDLNLDINTQALQRLQYGHDGTGLVLRNLITEQGITNTRTRHYRNFGAEGSSQYADYVLVSEGVDIGSFTVDNDNLASDHAPLIVSFS